MCCAVKCIANGVWTPILPLKARERGSAERRKMRLPQICCRSTTASRRAGVNAAAVSGKVPQKVPQHKR